VLVRPIRRQLIFAATAQELSAVLSVVPFIAVAELGRILLAPHSRYFTLPDSPRRPQLPE
jgi:hypothetical protein